MERRIFTPILQERHHQDVHEEVCIIASVKINGTNTTATFPMYRSIELFYSSIPYFGPDLLSQFDSTTVNLELRKGSLNEFLLGFSKLEHLKISDTGLNSFGVLPLIDKKLQTLVIHERLITIFPSNVQFLEKLKLLDLSGCTLTTVDLRQLAGLTQLSVLNLADNQLASIEAPDHIGLVNLPALAMFDVHQNELSRIDLFPEMFPALKFTRIMQNRWDCDWVSEVREKIWKSNITVLGTDLYCGRRINNGGLCCSYANAARARLAIAKTMLSVLDELRSNENNVESIDPLITFKVFENETVNGRVMGVEMKNVGVFLQKPIAV